MPNQMNTGTNAAKQAGCATKKSNDDGHSAKGRSLRHLARMKTKAIWKYLSAPQTFFSLGDSDKLSRLVRPSAGAFTCTTKDTLGLHLLGGKADRWAMNMVRGRKHAHGKMGVPGMSLLALLGWAGMVTSWLATFGLIHIYFVFCGSLVLPYCLVNYILLNWLICKKLLLTFQVWYMLCNIIGVLVSLGTIFGGNLRILTLIFMFPNLLLALFLDGLPFAFRTRIWVSYWFMNITSLVITQCISYFREGVVSGPETNWDYRLVLPFGNSVEVLHVASSCNINLLVLSVNLLICLLQRPNCFVMLTSSMECIKVSGDVAASELLMTAMRQKERDHRHQSLHPKGDAAPTAPVHAPAHADAHASATIGAATKRGAK